MAKKNGYEFNLNNVTYKEVMNLDLEDRSVADQKSLGLVVKTLEKWPHDQEINEENIMNLGLLDFAELQREFNRILEESFRVSSDAEQADV